MTSGNSPSCAIQGSEHFAAAGSEAELCERFVKEFADALGESAPEGQFNFALSITKDGTITVRVLSGDGTVTRTYPEVSVDVMDRALDYRDVSQLAKAAAQVVKMDQSSG